MQASDRSFRIGQKKNVIVHKFITKGTLEEKIDNMINKKTELIYNVIETSDLKLSGLSNSQILGLVSLNDKEES